MTRAAIALLLLLTACGDGEVAKAPPPANPGADAIGYYCNMALAEHPGPKGQAIVKGRDQPIWFSSARDTLAFTMLPEEPKDIAGLYVTAMDKAASWENPGPTSWIDARQAFYVTGSDAKGGMGQRELVPFSTREAAQAFVAKHGGRVVAFTEVPRNEVLGEDTPAAQAQKDAHKGGGH